MQFRNAIAAVLLGVSSALLAAGASAADDKAGQPGAEAGKPVKMIKRASLLGRKPGQTREEFLAHWLDVHAPLAYKIPGIARYTCTIVTRSSTRSDGPAPMDVEVDGIAEMWFTDQKSLEMAVKSPAFAALRADGAAFIGREIDFVTEEVVIIPRPQ